MKVSEYGGCKRGGKQQLAITSELLNVLRQVNFNSSWKTGSTKFNKTKTGCMRPDSKYSNVMTEQDLDKLFNKSKEKIKLKTEIVIMDEPTIEVERQRFKDFTAIKFLQLQDQFDKMLTGLPLAKIGDKENIKMHLREEADLTVKFKKDYIVGKVVGEGAYASVRVAVYKPQSRKIAIKAYEKAKIRQSQRKKTVRREIKILQMLDHPNIVKIFDVVQTNNHVNIIMEYLPGISLGTSLKQQLGQKFTQSNCKTIIRDLARALKFIHQKNIAHRDIKLQNIILDDRNSPKLIDFGFSTCIQKNKKMKIFCGTPSYMAPQIVQKREYRGQAADIWALGVMLFVMLTGYFPYKGTTDEQLYRKINLADYPKNELTSYKRAAHLISKMFIIDPDERITAEGILNHAWLTESSSLAVQDLAKRTRNDPSELKRLLNNSKERESYYNNRIDERSKKKKQFELGPDKPLLKTVKDLSNKLGNTMGRAKMESRLQGKLERTMVNPTRQDTSQSNKKPRREEVRIVDLLKLQLKKRSQQKSKCKSHRF